MLTDVRHLHSETLIDAVVFSGDFSVLGDDADFAPALEFLLIPLERTLGLERDRFVLVPGNHDVDHNRVDSYPRRDYGSCCKIVIPSTDYSQLPTSSQQPQPPQRHGTPLDQGFMLMCRALTPSVLFAFVHVWDPPGGSLGIVALNSAWRSSSDLDHGKLLIGEARRSQRSMR